MQPDTLRERIELQQSSETRSALGEVAQTWATYASRWASVKTLRSSEVLTANQTGLTITHRVRLRHIAEIKSSHRIKWRGRVLHIVSVLELENLTVHELLCEEVADG